MFVHTSYAMKKDKQLQNVKLVNDNHLQKLLKQ